MLKKAYQAAPGVVSVNGSVVPEDGVVHLTEAEALYDQAHGNITEVVTPALGEVDPPPPRRRLPK